MMKKIVFYYLIWCCLFLSWCSMFWLNKQSENIGTKSWQKVNSVNKNNIISNSWSVNNNTWTVLTWNVISWDNISVVNSWTQYSWTVYFSWNNNNQSWVYITDLQIKTQDYITKLEKVIQNNPSKLLELKAKYDKLSKINSEKFYQYWLINYYLQLKPLINLSNKNIINYVTWENNSVYFKANLSWKDEKILIPQVDFSTLVEVSAWLDWYKDQTLLSLAKDNENIYTCWYPCKNSSCLNCKITDWADRRTLKALNTVFFVDDYFVYYLFLKNIDENRKPIFMKIDWLKPTQVKIFPQNKYFIKSPLGVYYLDINEYKVKKLQWIDQNTFVLMDCDYAKDQNKIYYIKQSIWQDSDFLQIFDMEENTKNFKVVNIPWFNCFLKVNNRIYIKNQEVTLKFDPEKIDLSKLYFVNQYYQKDTNTVFYNWQIITWADAKSFYVDKKYSNSMVWFDKESVFYQWIKYPWLSPDSVNMMWESIFHDKMTNKDYYFTISDWKLVLRELFEKTLNDN